MCKLVLNLYDDPEALGVPWHSYIHTIIIINIMLTGDMDKASALSSQ